MKEKIDMNNLPHHVAIIMDGNGRWAKKFLMKREAGHRAGAQALRRLVDAMNEAGFKVLTVYAFSTENWKRSEAEVSYLMGLIHEYLDRYIDDAHKKNVQIRIIGDTTALEPALRVKIAELTEITKNKDGLLLNIAVNYGGKDEIVRAVRSINAKGEEITEDAISCHLDTKDLPDPDLIIRTSGEMRLSGFLLWQAAYAEFYATDTLWPDFKTSDLYEAIYHYQKRERRFGGR
ncbi:MAG: isoprenyl transferase [Defluviitaleaceae bacterium]|nr:isoprenyl transferase [Defluviitaleaceae bacterium]